MDTVLELGVFSKPPPPVRSGPSSEHSLVSETGDRHRFPRGSDRIAGKICTSVSSEGGHLPLVANPVTTVLGYRETRRNLSVQTEFFGKRASETEAKNHFETLLKKKNVLR